MITRDNYLWQKIILLENSTFHEVLMSLNESGLKIVLVIDNEGTFLGTISDGDIRRAFLKGVTQNSLAKDLINKSAIKVLQNVKITEVQALMGLNKINQIPVIDDSGRLIGLHIGNDLTNQPELINQVIIMAGGRGLRMRSLTKSTPKPMLDFLGKPILHHTIENLVQAGFRNINISTHYLSNIIENYFKDGSEFGCNINYLKEIKALGTAGSIGLLEKNLNLPFIVVNGDLVTKIKYRAMLDYHYKEQSFATMAVSLFEWQNPYGVAETLGNEIINFYEKPVNYFLVNAGIYVFSPAVVNIVREIGACDINNLFERLRQNSLKTIAFPLHEKWADIGNPDDYRNLNNGN